jgi:hypothetical protein
MRKVKVLVLALLLSVLTSPTTSAAEICSQLNVPGVADDNLTITMTAMKVTEKTGSFQLSISYKMLNATTDKKIDEGAFKIFFTDGTSEPQYGFFGTFFPGDSRERSHMWEYLKSKTPIGISYNSGFFGDELSPLKLNWAPPGQDCSLLSSAVKTAADKVAAEKAAADKAAADKVAAEKAAAEFRLQQAAENKAAQAAAVKFLVDQTISMKDDLILRINSLIKRFPAGKADLNAILKSISSLGSITEMNFKETETLLYGVENQIDVLEKRLVSTRTTITCIKGKLTKKVTAVNPKCPSGYKKK